MNKSKDEIIFMFILAFFLACLTSIDYIMHYTLYRFGLRFSYEWANIYWTVLGLLWLASALLASSAYFIDRHIEERTKIKGGLIFATVLSLNFGGFLDTLWFVYLKMLGHSWDYAFKNWDWHVYSKIFGYWSMRENIALNVVVGLLLIGMWAYVLQRPRNSSRD